MDKLKKYKEYKTILSVGALIWCKGKVLLLKRADDKNVDPGVYSVVGGKVEPHESFYDAILREIKEETGLNKFESIRLYSVTQHPSPRAGAEWVNLYFHINIAEQIEVPSSEDGEFYWIDPSDVDRLPIVKDLQEYIKILAKNPKAFMFGFFDNNEEGQLISKTIKIT